MKNKIIFRILGALASALIITSVFVPYVSVVGHTYSLWNSYSDINSLYLPIMIIVFGAIGVIFFSLNFKTEFAYTSTGAITFFLIMQTIEILDQGAFNSLSLGYYLLAIGAVLTGVMAFLCNLKTKIKEKENIQNNEVQAPSMLDQIDKLYNEQPNSQIEPIQPINIEPIPVAPVIEPSSIQPIQETVVQTQNTLEQTQVNSFQPQQINNINDSLGQTQIVQTINPVVQEFNQPVNPVMQEFAVNNIEQPKIVVDNSQNIQPMEPIMQNPVIQDLTLNNVQQPNFKVNNVSNIEPFVSNPVVQEFSNFSTPNQIIPTINNNSNNNEVDIFGQPVNRG